MNYIAGPTGGLNYHWAAARYRNSLWSPFVSQVSHWLDEVWQPRANELILFGPSAGWTLDRRFLARFKRLVCVEPDPLARFLFRRRFNDLGQTRWIGDHDIIPWFTPSSRWREFFASVSTDSAVLFSNVLGQLPLLGLHGAPAKRNVDDFWTALRGREWASYHDLFSSSDAAKTDAPTLVSPSTENLAENFFSAGATVIDHETLWLSGKQTELATAVWRIRPRQWHIIGLTHSRD